MFFAKTSEAVTARKMSVYWPTLLLLNGINVYPGCKNKGIRTHYKFDLFERSDRTTGKIVLKLFLSTTKYNTVGT